MSSHSLFAEARNSARHDAARVGKADGSVDTVADLLETREEDDFEIVRSLLQPSP